jgi:hypothetical protein
MFTPSQQDVRRFFCDSFKKSHAREILTALEADYSVDQGKSNPFLHLSMHLSISEQISVDQPRGVKHAFQILAKKLNSEHEAHHQMMECLGEMMWNSQRTSLPPDGEAYIEALRKRAS